MHSHFTAVFDACVLYPATIRNVLVQLATTGLFRARWTDEIHEEWINALVRSRPDITRESLDRVRCLIDRAVPDCLVRGYTPLIDSLVLPDANDRHVLAAAIRCGADVIVTINLRHFPTDTIGAWGIAAQHPDEFVVHLLDLDADAVCEAVRSVRARMHHPPFDADAYLDLLRRRGMPLLAERLRPHHSLI